jgi:hypothetical protein
MKKVIAVNLHQVSLNFYRGLDSLGATTSFGHIVISSHAKKYLEARVDLIKLFGINLLTLFKHRKIMSSLKQCSC